ncbi:hypothetical protein ACH5RR_001109 [Cinchona calisaya]|uniref:Uncharacterized protein n=1 Tax=Cinchona calisaya TaxID=153742 RepID=A0ABD3B2L9_9GENT
MHRKNLLYKELDHKISFVQRGRMSPRGSKRLARPRSWENVHLQPEVKFIDLAQIIQKARETASQCIEIFKTSGMRCNARILEKEFVATALIGIQNFKLLKHFEGKMFRDLVELASRVNYFEKIQQQGLK